jgi:hypothetical protein
METKKFTEKGRKTETYGHKSNESCHYYIDQLYSDNYCPLYFYALIHVFWVFICIECLFLYRGFLLYCGRTFVYNDK